MCTVRYSKIVKLKEGIDKEYVKDPLEKLIKKMEAKKLSFSLKPVTVKQVEKLISFHFIHSFNSANTFHTLLCPMYMLTL